MPKINEKIFLVAGGTGGHLFPAIALSQKDKEKKYIFIIDKRVEKILKKFNSDYFIISSSRLERNLILLPFVLTKILMGFLKSIYLIHKFKPKLIIGFGGYSSIPTILAAKILNIETLIHEQNALMGRTNRILSKICNKTAISFKTTKFAKKDSYYTGIPIRSFKKKKIHRKKKRILIIGGSQGAKIFSNIMPKLLTNIPQNLKKQIVIIQQVRNEDKARLILEYKKMKIDFVLKTFFNDVQNQIYNSDIIFTRCGSSTLAEIEACKKNSFLFPLPTSLDNHQFLNAIEHKKNNNCEIYDETKIDYKFLEKKFINEIKKSKKNNLKANQKKKISLIKLIDDIIKKSDV